MQNIDMKKLINAFDERYQKSIQLIEKMREIMVKDEYLKIIGSNKKIITYVLNKYLDEKNNN